MTEHVFKGHFADLFGQYGKVVMVNLVKEHNLQEKKLTEGLESLLKKSKL